MTSTNLSDTDVIRRAAELAVINVVETGAFTFIKIGEQFWPVEQVLESTDALLELVGAVMPEGISMDWLGLNYDEFVIRAWDKDQKYRIEKANGKEIVSCIRAALLALLRQVVEEKSK